MQIQQKYFNHKILVFLPFFYITDVTSIIINLQIAV